MFVIVAFARGRYFCSTASTPMVRNPLTYFPFTFSTHGLMSLAHTLSWTSLLG